MLKTLYLPIYICKKRDTLLDFIAIYIIYRQSNSDAPILSHGVNQITTNNERKGIDSFFNMRTRS